MASVNIKLPNGETKEFNYGKPVIILGANGAGKTRFSVKIEELNDSSYHGRYQDNSFLVKRISAQKSLNLSEDLQIKGVNVSEREVYVGGTHINATKFSYLYSEHPVTKLIDDYDRVLSLLFARNNLLLEQQHQLDREAVQDGKSRPPLIKTLIEQIEDIWDYLLPSRKLDLSGNEVYAINSSSRYHGKEMSDGERVILYMISQVMTAKQNSLIIIDEPELHIHKAIVNKLWDKLELIRQDCVFMYITHDLDFAVSRNIDEVLWVKSYNGNDSWDYEFLPLQDYSDLPQSLLFEIIGSKKKILFVEGTRDSLDYLFYQELAKEKDYHVIPCGGCQEVIRCVKAKKGYSKFNSIEVYGIIDRDFRMEHELSELMNDGILHLEVAEIENLFVVPELLKIVQERLYCDPSVFESAVAFIVELYEGLKDKQISEAFKKEIEFQLGNMHFEQKELTVDNIKGDIDGKFSREYIETILVEKQGIYNSAIEIKDILRVFNFKELSKKISGKFDLKNNEYPNRVINMLKYDTDIKQLIIDALKPYVPELP